MEFFNQKFNDLERLIRRKIDTSKRSILYNIEHKMDELKLAMVASNIPKVPKGTVQDLVAAIKTPLPIANLDDFLEFDKAVDEDQEKKKALVKCFFFLRILIHIDFIFKKYININFSYHFSDRIISLPLL